MPKKSTSTLFQEDELNEELVEQAVEKPVKKKVTEVENNTAVEDDIQDIDLSVIKKRKFRINGDNSKILELNVSDMGIVTRLKEAYPRLNSLMDSVADKFSEMPDEVESEDELIKLSNTITEIDNKMRDEMDYIFNANVSEICGSEGSMWDPIEGSFRYEHIIDKLAKLYENNLDKEYANIKRRVESTAGKYVKLQDHKKKVKR